MKIDGYAYKCSYSYWLMACLYETADYVMKRKHNEWLSVLSLLSEENEDPKILEDSLTDQFDSALLNAHQQEPENSEETSDEYEIEKKKYEEWKRKMDQE